MWFWLCVGRTVGTDSSELPLVFFCQFGTKQLEDETQRSHLLALLPDAVSEPFQSKLSAACDHGGDCVDWVGRATQPLFRQNEGGAERRQLKPAGTTTWTQLQHGLMWRRRLCLQGLVGDVLRGAFRGASRVQPRGRPSLSDASESGHLAQSHPGELPQEEAQLHGWGGTVGLLFLFFSCLTTSTDFVLLYLAVYMYPNVQFIHEMGFGFFFFLLVTFNFFKVFNFIYKYSPHRNKQRDLFSFFKQNLWNLLLVALVLPSFANFTFLLAFCYFYILTTLLLLLT